MQKISEDQCSITYCTSSSRSKNGFFFLKITMKMRTIILMARNEPIEIILRDKCIVPFLKGVAVYGFKLHLLQPWKSKECILFYFFLAIKISFKIH